MTTYAEKYLADLAEIKESLCLLIQGVAPKAKVTRSFIWDPDKNLWPGMLRSPLDLVDDDPEQQRIHTISVFYQGLGRDELGAPVKTMTPVVPFGIAFYMAAQLGNSTVNAEVEMMAEAVKVQWELEATTNLNSEHVSHHRGFQIPRFRVLQTTPPMLSGTALIEVVMRSRYLRKGDITP